MQKKRKDNRQVKPKKLDPKTRRRNRIIAFALLGAMVFFFISKCSDSTDTKMSITDQNSTNSADLEQNKSDNSTLSTSSLNFVKKDKSEFDNANLLPSNKELAIGKLLEEYRKKPTFSRALAIAEFYYSGKNYKNAVSWSVVANKIDSHKKRSWIIYIKSKIAQKEYKKAIEAIKAYLKLYDSKQLKKLLEVLEAKTKER